MSSDDAHQMFLILQTDYCAQLSCLEILSCHVISDFSGFLYASGVCGCCGALRPRYKRLVDNIFPEDPEVRAHS